MKRSSGFVIAFAAAALTFGSLFAFVGPKHFQHCGHKPCYHHQDKGHCSDSKDTLSIPSKEDSSKEAI